MSLVVTFVVLQDHNESELVREIEIEEEQEVVEMVEKEIEFCHWVSDAVAAVVIVVGGVERVSVKIPGCMRQRHDIKVESTLIRGHLFTRKKRKETQQGKVYVKHVEADKDMHGHRKKTNWNATSCKPYKTRKIVYRNWKPKKPHTSLCKNKKI